MVTLVLNNNYQGLIFDDGVQQFIRGARWEGDYVHEDLAADFRDYFNKNFSRISDEIEVRKGVKVIRIHCSIDKFPEQYSEWHDNATGKMIMKKFGSGEKYFEKIGIPTLVLGDDISLEDFFNL